MTNVSEREKLLSFLFDRNDKRVKNIKFSRGNAEDLTLEDMCQTAREVIADTWEREDNLVSSPPVTTRQSYGLTERRDDA